MSRSALCSSFTLLAALAVTGHAHAQLMQPNGDPIPVEVTSDIGGGEVAIWNTTTENMSLWALFDTQPGDQDIDFQLDATLDMQVFSPMCGFSGDLILRGSGCFNDFGWYNIDAADYASGNRTPPRDSDIHVLISAAQMETLQEPGTEQPGFYPRVGSPAVQGEFLESIRDDPRYTGGLVGFALVGNSATGPVGPNLCTQTKYSERSLNVQSPSGEPWITMITYRSAADPNSFYIAWEDLPMLSSDWHLTGTDYQNDGDFNDFVFKVTGLTCVGGGEPCLAGGEGACGFGLMECQADGSLTCVSQFEATTEVCDNIDNDCDGMVDNGDELCPAGEVCSRGRCHPNCAGGEFPCQTPLQCDDSTGLCVEPECMDVVCEGDQVCIGGSCVGGCDNVVCPQGQLCQLGRCLNPCVNRECPDGPGGESMVCEGGVCVTTCQCRPCAVGLECNNRSGTCVPAGCTGVSCHEGQVCQGGVCVDACEGVVCPGGAPCEGGFCQDPFSDHTAAGATGGGGSGTGGLIGGGGDPGGEMADLDSQDPGCSCRTTGSRSSAAWPLLALLALFGIRRERRSPASTTTR